MRKNDVIRENQNLKIEIERQRQKIDSLNDTISDYKKTFESLRSFYGEKLIELENKRLMNLHPDILAEAIDWYPEDIDRFLTSAVHRYNFIYRIKGEINNYEIRQF